MLNPNNLLLLLYLDSDENALARLLAFLIDALVLLLSPSPLSSGGGTTARRLLLSASIAMKGEDCEGDDDDDGFVEALDVGSLRASIA